MPVLPTTIVGQIEFAENHVGPWLSNTAAIGLNNDDVQSIKAATLAARAKYQAAQQAREAAKTATMEQKNAVDDLTRRLSEAIRRIRLYAESTSNPGVFALAAIPAPAPPAPQPPPTQPTNLAAQIEPAGALRIIFKATNPDTSGAVTYLVKRKLAGEGGFRFIGTTGTSRPVRGLPRGFRAFIDDTLPSGANNFQYMIQGQRGEVFGPSSEIFTVVIGVGPDGQQVATLKMAA